MCPVMSDGKATQAVRIAVHTEGGLVRGTWCQSRVYILGGSLTGGEVQAGWPPSAISRLGSVRFDRQGRTGYLPRYLGSGYLQTAVHFAASHLFPSLMLKVKVLKRPVSMWQITDRDRTTRI